MFHSPTVDMVPYAGTVALAQHNQNGCAVCDSIVGPFSSGTTTSGDPLHLCKTCVGTAAAAHGWTPPETRAELNTVLESFQAAVRERDAQIEQLKANLSVPLAEVVDLLEERAKRRPAETAPAA